MCKPQSQPHPELFPLADAASAAQKPLEEVRAHLGGAAAPQELTQVELVSLLQHYGRLPAGEAEGFWLTHVHLGAVTNRRPSTVHVVVATAAETIEPPWSQHITVREGPSSTHYFRTAALIWVLRHYNFLPSPEMQEFTATSHTIMAAIEQRFGYQVYTMPQLRQILAVLPIEHRRFNLPHFQTGKPPNSYRPSQVMPLVMARAHKKHRRSRRRTP